MGRWRRLALLMATGLVLGAAAPATAQPPAGSAAPDITGGPWVNSPPLTLAALRGRVVLVEFWTYG